MYKVWNLLIIYCLVNLLLFFVSCDPTRHRNWRYFNNRICGISNTNRIIGGEIASLGMYPWIARLGYLPLNESQVCIDNYLNPKTVFRCGGTLISKFHILTAAHCIKNMKFNLVVVRLGEHYAVTNPDCENGFCADPVQDFFPQKLIFHENYNKPVYKNDIAIIKLSQPVPFNDYIKPICMPQGELLTKNFTGQFAETAGWGFFTIKAQKTSDILRTIKLPIVNIDNCKRIFSKMTDIGREQMCVGGKIGKDSCIGDSGGPLMKVESVNGPPRYYLLGVVSFGAVRCAQTNWPAVYTKISFYLNWILHHLTL